MRNNKQLATVIGASEVEFVRGIHPYGIVYPPGGQTVKEPLVVDAIGITLPDGWCVPWAYIRRFKRVDRPLYPQATAPRRGRRARPPVEDG